MKGAIRLHTLHADGKKEKLALNVLTGDKVPLTAATIGVDAQCYLEVGETAVKIIALEGAPEFRFANTMGREFEIKPGDIWEGASCIIEFLSLPQPATEEATRYVSFSKAETPADPAPNSPAGPAAIPAASLEQSAPAPEPTPSPSDEADATSIIFKMRVPERVADPVNPGQRKMNMEVVGAPDRPRIDPEERKRVLLSALASLGIIATGAEMSALLAGWITHGRIHITPGLSALTMTAFASAVAVALHHLKTHTPWFGTPLELLRRSSFASSGASVVIALIMSSVSAFSVSRSAPTQPVEPVSQPMSQSPQNPAEIAQVPAPAAPTTPVTQVAQAPAAPEIPANAPVPPPQDPAQPAPGTPSAPAAEVVAQAPAPAPVSAPVPAPAPAPAEMEPDMARDEFFSAIRSKDFSLVRRLVENRAVHVNLTLDRGFSALHRAAIKGDLLIVKYLISKRANLNAKDPNGNTPLMWATFKRHNDVVQYLVKRGADLNAKREDGYRAVDIAKRYGLKSYVALLTPKEPTRGIASLKKNAAKFKAKAVSKKKSGAKPNRSVASKPARKKKARPATRHDEDTLP